MRPTWLRWRPNAARVDAADDPFVVSPANWDARIGNGCLDRRKLEASSQRSRSDDAIAPGSLTIPWTYLVATGATTIITIVAVSLATARLAGPGHRPPCCAKCDGSVVRASAHRYLLLFARALIATFCSSRERSSLPSALRASAHRYHRPSSSSSYTRAAYSSSASPHPSSASAASVRFGAAVDVARLAPCSYQCRELHQLHLVLLELTVGEMVCRLLLVRAQRESPRHLSGISSYSLSLAAWNSRHHVRLRRPPPSRTAAPPVPSMSRISRRSRRRARSAPSRAGSAAAEF